MQKKLSGGADLPLQHVKDLTVRPIPMAGGFWGGFASESIIGHQVVLSLPSVPVNQVSHVKGSIRTDFIQHLIVVFFGKMLLIPF
jgi:hypothetical protein